MNCKFLPAEAEADDHSPKTRHRGKGSEVTKSKSNGLESQ